MVGGKVKLYQHKFLKKASVDPTTAQVKERATSQLIKIAFNIFEFLQIIWSFNFKIIDAIDQATFSIIKVFPTQSSSFQI